MALTKIKSTGIDTLTTDVSLDDDTKIKFGDSDDLVIYHHNNGSSYIQETGSGDLNILGSNFRVMNAGGTENKILATSDGSVALYHNNIKKLETNTAGVTVTGNISNTSGDFTLDVAGDISLDADGGEFKFLDGGSESLVIGKTGGSPYIYPTAQDSDLIFLGNDGGSQITALRLDMSDGGVAFFNNDIRLNDNRVIRLGDDQDFRLYFEGTHGVIHTTTANSDILFKGNDDGSAITALTLDMSNAGAATFNSNVTIGGNLTVNGTQTIINSTTLTIDDLNIVLAQGAGTASAANAAGITIDGAGAVMQYLSSGDEFHFNKDIRSDVDITATGQLAGGSLSVDTVSINGSTYATSGNMVFDSANDILLDADGGNVSLRDNGTPFGNFNHNGNNLKITSTITNGHIVLEPNGTGNLNIYSDTVAIQGTEGESAKLMLQSDEADDNADIWTFEANTSNVLGIGNQISGSYVDHLTITPNATIRDSVAAFKGKVYIDNTLEVGVLTNGLTGNMIINSEGGNPPGLQVKSRTNRARINVQDNDTSGYIIAEGNVFSFGFADAVSNNNININTSHNVGIGTYSIDEKFQVEGGNIKIEAGAVATNRGLILAHTGQTGNQTILEQYADGNPRGRLHTTQRRLVIEAGSGGGTGTGEKLELWTNASRALTVDTSQKVGIGTSSPSYLLHAENTTATGPSYIATSGNGQFIMAMGSQNSPGVAQEAFIGTLNDTRFKIKVNNVVKGSWTDGGLAIGTHSSASAPLDVVTNSNVYAAEFTQSNTSNGDGVFISVGSTAAADYALTVRSNNGNHSVLAAKANGQVGIGVFVPDRMFHVKGDATNVVGKFESTDSIAAIEFADPGGSAEIGNNGNDLVFFPAGADKGRFHSTTGQFLVATDQTSTNCKVHVAGGIRFNAFSPGHGLNTVSYQTFNNSNTANACGSVYYAMFAVNIYHNNGHSQCLFVSNGGGGVGYNFTGIVPGNTNLVTGTGINTSFTTIGSSPNTFTINISSGGGALSVRRTNGTGSFGVSVHKWAGG